MNDHDLTNDVHRLAVLQEEMNGKIQAILEVVMPMRQEMTEMREVIADIPEMKADIKIIKQALTTTNLQVHDHERRITRLEGKAELKAA